MYWNALQVFSYEMGLTEMALDTELRVWWLKAYMVSTLMGKKKTKKKISIGSTYRRIHSETN